MLMQINGKKNGPKRLFFSVIFSGKSKNARSSKNVLPKSQLYGKMLLYN
jgi:hypothetical protein